MKNVILLSLVVLIMTIVNAHAEVYECSSEEHGEYLVVLTADSGIVFQRKDGYYQELNSNVSVMRAMDGGPISIRAASSDYNDWQRIGCYYKRKTNQFTIHHESTLQIIPEFQMNQDPMCQRYSLPRPMVLPPQPINCKLK